MTFFTVGYGGRPPGSFADLLADHGVRTVVDVRLRPDRAHMGSYVKARTPDKGIEKLLAGRGIGYVSLVELGNLFLGRDDWPELYRSLIDGSGELLTARLDDVPAPFCLLCAEKRAAECHRKTIADFLARSRGWAAVHIE